MIDRTLLRSQVKKEILRRIINGALKPGERINESRLATELGVSRTPLREALTALEQDYVLDSDAGRGFFVKELSSKELREAVPIAAALECLALRISPPPDQQLIDRLEKINIKMESTLEDGEALARLDEDYHALLLKNCSNDRLKEIIHAIRNQIRRYDFAYMASPGQGKESVVQHRELQKHWLEGNLDAAADVLARNWTDSLDFLLDWLSNKD